jgi:alpha-glucosidase (family GH31 glycosyl hydrolase)
MLAWQPYFTATSGNVGCFFWAHDLGGFGGKRNPELFARWMQWGVLNSSYRIHSVRLRHLDRRPWLWGEQATESMRRSYHLRSKLIPYIYSVARACYTDTLPLIRSMYIDYPEKEAAYNNPQQVLLGSHILGAPIASPGEGDSKLASQTVWFPDGQWFNYFSGVKYTAGQHVTVESDINEFPLYFRGGTPIPMQPYRDRMTTAPLDELVIRCYPGVDGERGTFELYEDDGQTQAYMSGQFAVTRLSYHRKDSSVTINIAPAEGAYEGQVTSRSYTVQLPCVSKPESVNLNGKATDYEYDPDTFTATVKTGKFTISKGIVMTVKATEIDPKLTARKESETQK